MGNAGTFGGLSFPSNVVGVGDIGKINVDLSDFAGSGNWNSAGLGGLGNIGGVLGVPNASQFTGSGQLPLNVDMPFSHINFDEGPQISDFDRNEDGEISDEERSEFQKAMSIFIAQNNQASDPAVTDNFSSPVTKDEERPVKEPGEDDANFLERLAAWARRLFGGEGNIQIGGIPNFPGGGFPTFHYQVAAILAVVAHPRLHRHRHLRQQRLQMEHLCLKKEIKALPLMATAERGSANRFICGIRTREIKTNTGSKSE